ncbi:hypothetical protein GE253_22990 [Niveispirillum sp. SYP-B3756]|uniref:hypothetical protein n=1 Tax=Niveispirillum sp. SYP-B3756 TaxID=2662178 RepID=UPI0012928041|nr:hypothetical protein [Niveispirillum sp. SYP-B3756]MQP68189.1 hypothetical protein [Niveispirillum sp. SYP-B3756]
MLMRQTVEPSCYEGKGKSQSGAPTAFSSHNMFILLELFHWLETSGRAVRDKSMIAVVTGLEMSEVTKAMTALLKEQLVEPTNLRERVPAQTVTADGVARLHILRQLRPALTNQPLPIRLDLLATNAAWRLKCLQCKQPFASQDRRSNRICPICTFVMKRGGWEEDRVYSIGVR